MLPWERVLRGTWLWSLRGYSTGRNANTSMSVAKWTYRQGRRGKNPGCSCLDPFSGNRLQVQPPRISKRIRGPTSAWLARRSPRAFPSHCFIIRRIPAPTPGQPLEPPSQETTRAEALPGVVFNRPPWLEQGSAAISKPAFHGVDACHTRFISSHEEQPVAARSTPASISAMRSSSLQCPRGSQQRTKTDLTRHWGSRARTHRRAAHAIRPQSTSIAHPQ